MKTIICFFATIFLLGFYMSFGQTLPNCENNLLLNGNFNTATCGGDAFGANCVQNWSSVDGTPSLFGYPANPYAWMWSYSGSGEAIAANFNFVSGLSYTISFRVYADDKNSDCPIVANTAFINLVATNNPGSITANPNGQILFKQLMGPYLNNWSTVSITFTANANYSNLWVFPFMQGFDGNCQSELSIDDICIQENISTEGAYCCEGENLVVNGNFEFGNTGFSSSYTNNAAVYPGQYNVTNSAAPFGATVTDHSYCADPLAYATNDNYMLINGKTQKNGSSVIWTQRITGLEKGQEYKFCANFKDMEQCTFNILPNITMSAGSFSTTQVINTDDNDPCDWQKIEICFTAESSRINLKIVLDQTGNGDGNDLAIDDIALQQKLDPNYFITVQHQGNNNDIMGSLNTISNSDDTLLNADCDFEEGPYPYYWFVYEPLDPTAPLNVGIKPLTFGWANATHSGGDVIPAVIGPWNLTTTFTNYPFANNKFYVIGMYIPSCCESCYTESWEYQITYNNGFAPSNADDFSDEMKEDIKRRFVKSKETTLGIDEIKNEKEFILYPNPAQDSFNISLLSDSLKSVEVYSLTGQTIIFRTIKDGKTEENIDVSSLASGMYLINVAGESGKHYTAKLMKE